MNHTTSRSAKTIRMNDEVYHRAKVAAVVSRSTLAQWIEEAVLEKVHREAVQSLPGSRVSRVDEFLPEPSKMTAG